MSGFTAWNKLRRINEPGKLNLPLRDYYIFILETQLTWKLHEQKLSPPMKFKGSPWHSTYFAWWRNTLGRWHNENLDAWEVQRNWDGHIQSKHTSIQFPLLQAYLSCNFFWLAQIEKGRGCRLFSPQQAMMVSLFRHEYYTADHFSDLWKSFHVWTRCDWLGITWTVNRLMSLCTR